MRKEGTKYPVIKRYDSKLVPVSVYATETNTAVAQLYTQYDRHIIGYKRKDGTLTGTKAPYPGYKIVQFNKMNYVIPD